MDARQLALYTGSRRETRNLGSHNCARLSSKLGFFCAFVLPGIRLRWTSEMVWQRKFMAFNVARGLTRGSARGLRQSTWCS